jgi:uroporphyrinogen decarboxylase
MKTPTESASIIMGAQSNDHSARLASVSSKRFFTDALTFARVQLLITAYYWFDTPINFWDVYNIEAEALGQPVVYLPHSIPDVDRRRPLITSASDLDRIKPPDPYKSGRMPWLLEINQYYLEMTGKLERVYFTAPYSLAVSIRGYENLMCDMLDNPGFVHTLFKFLCDDVIALFVETMRSEIDSPHLIADGRDTWASPPT